MTWWQTWTRRQRTEEQRNTITIRREKTEQIQENKGKYDERPREHNDIRIENLMKDQGYMTSDVSWSQFADHQRATLHPNRAPCTGRVLMTSWEDKKNDGQDGPHARNVCWRQGGVLGQGDKNNDGQDNKRTYKQGNKRLRGQDTKCNIATKTGPMQGRTKTTGQEQRWTREHPNRAPCKGRVKWQEDKNNDEQQHEQRTKHRTRGQYYKLTRGQDNKTNKTPRKQYAMRTRAKVKSKMITPKTSPMQGTSADDKETRRQEGNYIYERQENKPNARDEYIWQGGTRGQDDNEKWGQKNIYMRTSGQDNKRSKRIRENQIQGQDEICTREQRTRE